LEDVTSEIVESYFADLGDDELQLGAATSKL
jgi:hypothetical protein